MEGSGERIDDAERDGMRMVAYWSICSVMDSSNSGGALHNCKAIQHPSGSALRCGPYTDRSRHLTGI